MKMRNLLLAAAYFAVISIPVNADENSELTPDNLCIQCSAGGNVNGQAANGTLLDLLFTGDSKMCLDTIQLGDGNGPYVNFSKDGEPWPERPWGVRADSWKITCAK